MIERDVVATGVTVAGTHEPFVAGVDLVAPGGEVTLVPADPGLGQVALALAIGGRVDLAHGSVAIGGSTARRDLQVRTRLVDVPDVTAPEDVLPVRVVVAEELALAERPSSRRDVTAFLAERQLADRSRDRWDSLAPGTRTRLLLELGSWHPEVSVIVLTGPDRHGGDPQEWYAAARRLAERGLTVLAICSPATARALAHPTPAGDPA